MSMFAQPAQRPARVRGKPRFGRSAPRPSQAQAQQAAPAGHSNPMKTFGDTQGSAMMMPMSDFKNQGSTGPPRTQRDSYGRPRKSFDEAMPQKSSPLKRKQEYKPTLEAIRWDEEDGESGMDLAEMMGRSTLDTTLSKPQIVTRAQVTKSQTVTVDEDFTARDVEMVQKHLTKIRSGGAWSDGANIHGRNTFYITDAYKTWKKQRHLDVKTVLDWEE